MKAVFFKCSIPLEIHRINEEGKIVVESVTRHMEQGEVVDIEESEPAMIFTDGSIWWVPDKNLFNIVNYGNQNVERCCV